MIDERITIDLDNMKRAASDAIAIVGDRSEADFMSDLTLQLACAMCLVIIGEGAAKIEKRSPDFVASHPDWPWNEIRGMRNRIVHDYANLRLPTIWRTVRDSLPKLLTGIRQLGDLAPRVLPPQPPHNAS